MGASGMPNLKAEALKDPLWAIKGHPEAQSFHQEASFGHSNAPFIHSKALCGHLEAPSSYPNALKVA